VPLPDDVIGPGMSAEAERQVRRELRSRVARLSQEEKEARRLERNRRSAERVKRGLEHELQQLLAEEALLNSHVAQARRENALMEAYLARLQSAAAALQAQLSVSPVPLAELADESSVGDRAPSSIINSDERPHATRSST